MNVDRFNVPKYNEHYEGHYDDRGLLWRRIGAADKSNNLATLLGEHKVDTVLEVGCGTGAVLAAVAARGIGLRHVGVDLADPGKHKDPGADNMDVRVFDGVKLPFADGSMDLVYASHVIEHVPEPRSMLNEMSRVAKQLIYVEVPCELHARTNHAELQRSLNIGHINAYTPDSFQLLLESCGMSIHRFQVFDHSLAIHNFNQGIVKSRLKYFLRKALLGANPRLAAKLMTYHCGALIKVKA